MRLDQLVLLSACAHVWVCVCVSLAHVRTSVCVSLRQSLSIFTMLAA